jgi:hypothetical protein
MVRSVNINITNQEGINQVPQCGGLAWWTESADVLPTSSVLSYKI